MTEQESLADRAALAVLEENHMTREDGESPLSALGWYMGTTISYEDAQRQLVTKAIELHDAERATS